MAHDLTRTLFARALGEHAAVLAKVEAACAIPLAALAAACITSIRAGGKILFFGNGGSAGDAQHLATELVVRFSRNRKAIAAIALTTDTSLLTAAGNDLGFETIFARQIEALGRPGDVAIGISTSGKSPNVIAALNEAGRGKLVTAAFTGEAGLAGHADHIVSVPSRTTARIQEMHILIGQVLCASLEQGLGLVPVESEG
ncbi:MAG TPA: SIS domain-containing protein [Micropepsaceae bacterium]|nr:SIS domain-containing protein [Micropepsaceae bacterium]